VTHVPDENLQLLEAYLDDELSTDEVDALRERLIEEPELASALATLRESRSLRQKVYASLEPGELAVTDAVADVQTSVRNRLRWRRTMSDALRYSAAAACLVIGLTVGSQFNGQSAPNPYQPSANNDRPAIAGFGGNNYQTQTRPVTDRLVLGEDPGPASPVRFEPLTPRTVVLKDPQGRIIAATEFTTAAEARQFIEELQQAAVASGRSLIPLGNGPFPRDLMPAPVAPLNPAPSGNGSPIIPVAAERF